MVRDQGACDIGPRQRAQERTVRWTTRGVEFEADPRHVMVWAEHFGFTKESSSSAAAAYNGDRERKTDEAREEVEMDRAEAKLFRCMVARMNYVAQDASDLQYPSKEISKRMAKPTKGGWIRLKKIVRYMIGRKTVVWKYYWQREVGTLYVKTDSD